MLGEGSDTTTIEPRTDATDKLSCDEAGADSDVLDARVVAGQTDSRLATIKAPSSISNFATGRRYLDTETFSLVQTPRRGVL